MNKEEIAEKWEDASQFRLWRDGAKKFREIFPDRETLMDFYSDLAHTTWGGNYGQSRYDDAFGIAYDVKHGLSQLSLAWIKRNRGDETVENRIEILASFGIKLNQPAQNANQ